MDEVLRCIYHYNGILRSEEEDYVYIGRRKVVSIDCNFLFDLFGSQIRAISGSGHPILRSSTL